MANQWNKLGSLRGPQGPAGAAGPAGAQGAAGKSVRIANIDVMSNSDVAFSALSPADGVAVGDTVVDTKGDVYTIASVNADAQTVHVGQAIAGVTLKGPQGEPGVAGAPGKDGTSISVKGTVADAASLPADNNTSGDTYITSGDGHMHVWDGTAWQDLGAMKGPQGASIRTSTETPTSDHLVTISSTKPDGVAAGDTVICADGVAYTVASVGDVHVTLAASGVSVKGAQGERGEQGKQGPAGTGIKIGNGAPTATAQVGTLYLDTTADGDYSLYQYADNGQA